MIDTDQNSDIFSEDQIAGFNRDGYLIERNLVSPEYVDRILSVAERDADAHFGDIEYEADLQYPGAPMSLDEEGGRTIRRLRQAFSRDPIFTQLVKEPGLLHRLRQLLGPRLVMPLAHHNCIMTKHPKFSSDTGWHQDIRYWSFYDTNLVNVWLALGDESLENGCLRLLPGSHRQAFESTQLDSELFFREDNPDNHELLNSAVTAELKAGDVLFFHARCFHAATRNYSTATKYSAVFTFRALENAPLENTRSSSLPELLL